MNPLIASHGDHLVTVDPRHARPRARCSCGWCSERVGSTGNAAELGRLHIEHAQVSDAMAAIRAAREVVELERVATLRRSESLARIERGHVSRCTCHGDWVWDGWCSITAREEREARAVA